MSNYQHSTLQRHPIPPPRRLPLLRRTGKRSGAAIRKIQIKCVKRELVQRVHLQRRVEATPKRQFPLQRLNIQRKWGTLLRPIPLPRVLVPTQQAGGKSGLLRVTLHAKSWPRSRPLHHLSRRPRPSPIFPFHRLWARVPRDQTAMKNERESGTGSNLCTSSFTSYWIFFKKNLQRIGETRRL